MLAEKNMNTSSKDIRQDCLVTVKRTQQQFFEQESNAPFSKQHHKSGNFHVIFLFEKC